MDKSIKFFLFIIVFLLLNSCSEPKPTLAIEEKKLKEILLDVHMAEAAMQPIIGLKKDSLKELYFSQIFEIHEVHPVDFEATMETLQADPERMKRIYRELTEEAKEKKKEYSKKKKERKDTTKTTSKSPLDTLSR